MKFEPVPLDEAEGKILAHNIARPDGRTALRKGKPITPVDLEALRRSGSPRVYVAEPEPGDVDENSAARRIAAAACGSGLRIQGEALGKTSLVSCVSGVLRVDAWRLEEMNSCPGLAFATLPDRSILHPDQVVASVKIIPYSLPASILAEAEKAAQGKTPVIRALELKPARVGLVLVGLPAAQTRLVRSFEPALRRRIEKLGSHLSSMAFVAMGGEEDAALLAQALGSQIDQGQELILLAGETSIMDAHDTAPCAVENAGGQVVCIGVPVDPGNLLMLAYLQDIPILGVPGCVRSAKENVVDRLLPSLLAGDRLNRVDLIRMGHGGLLQTVAP